VWTLRRAVVPLRALLELEPVLPRATALARERERERERVRVRVRAREPFAR